MWGPRGPPAPQTGEGVNGPESPETISENQNQNGVGSEPETDGPYHPGRAVFAGPRLSGGESISRHITEQSLFCERRDLGLEGFRVSRRTQRCRPGPVFPAGGRLRAGSPHCPPLLSVRCPQHEEAPGPERWVLSHRGAESGTAHPATCRARLLSWTASGKGLASPQGGHSRACHLVFWVSSAVNERTGVLTSEVSPGTGIFMLLNTLYRLGASSRHGDQY